VFVVYILMLYTTASIDGRFLVGVFFFLTKTSTFLVVYVNTHQYVCLKRVPQCYQTVISRVAVNFTMRGTGIIVGRSTKRNDTTTTVIRPPSWKVQLIRFNIFPRVSAGFWACSRNGCLFFRPSLTARFAKLSKSNVERNGIVVPWTAGKVGRRD